MQAGLAVLCNSDLEFVSGIITDHACGNTYDSRDQESVGKMVRNFLDHPEILQEMKRNAYDFARTEFNWEVQSIPYLAAIREFCDRN